jgi:hypothetical protein
MKMNDFNKLCTAMATLNDEQADRVVSYIETLGKSQDTLKAEDKWQRVIDEGYLCKFRDNIGDHWRLEYLVDTNGDKFLDDDGDVWDNCEVLREKGIKQPYFQGDNIPKFKDEGVLYHKDNSVTMFYDSETYADYTDWSEVIAYIEV